MNHILESNTVATQVLVGRNSSFKYVGQSKITLNTGVLNSIGETIRQPAKGLGRDVM